MRAMEMRWAGVAAALALAVVMAPAGGAQCLSGTAWKAQAKPAAWTATNGGARLMRAAYSPAAQDPWDAFAPIVGMWHVKLVATSTLGLSPAPPPGAEVDAGFQQWHSDGTEMLNSGRPAANSNFCMGVWEQVGLRTFKLNHFAISYTQGPPDASNPGVPTNSLVGPTAIVEEVAVSPDGKTFKGTFTITDYTETSTSHGDTITWHDSLTGTVTGTRVDVTTPVSPVF
jgi:hypothetical protein